MTTAAELLTHIRSYQHLDDDGHVWFALAVAVSAAYTDDPLWGMAIGSPSSGKTEIIRALVDLGSYVDDLTTAGLLTWQPGKRGKEGRQVGVLTRVGDRGLVLVGDFSTILATSDRGGRDQLFSLLRRAYDGSVDRDLGGAPGGRVRWAGRLTLLAGCTSAIDSYGSHEAALGPRWLYYRLPGRDTAAKRQASRTARANAGQLDVRRDDARVLAAEVVTAARRRQVPLPASFGDRLDDLAIVACYGRAAVPRNAYGRREIEGMAVIEEPPRIVGQLAMLARALLALNLDTADVLALCRRVALDSIPDPRRRLLVKLAADKQHSVSELARQVGAHRHVVRRSLEDLAAIGLVDSDDQGDDDDSKWAHSWWLDGEDTDLLRTVLQEDLWHKVCDPYTTNTPI